MNIVRPSRLFVSCIFTFWLGFRRMLPKRRCRSFGGEEVNLGLGIRKIYVINLDREPGRWANVKQELRQIRDRAGSELLSLTTRHVAVDAKAFAIDPNKDDEVDPHYTLGDQLFVEPQPLTLPSRMELNSPIRMSRAEVAVARSHISVWKQIVRDNHDYALVLEDDVWFRPGFTQHFDQAWDELMSTSGQGSGFDVLYVSYVEVKHGAPKTFLSKNVFVPERGLWHLSGYILSRQGAQKLLQLLPCRGPVDLWINHQFKSLNVRAIRCSLVSQRRDAKSTNSYSILPALTKIGALTCEGPSQFNLRPNQRPVFAFGQDDSGQTSLAMALSMLGYRCCSDLNDLPIPEVEQLLAAVGDPVFDAYVNIGALSGKIEALQRRYPNAKFILTTTKSSNQDDSFQRFAEELKGCDMVVLYREETNKWHIVCEHLRCAPPTCAFPELSELGKRPLLREAAASGKEEKCKPLRHDISPWVIDARLRWRGIRTATLDLCATSIYGRQKVHDTMENLEEKRWTARNDTFTDNLALFRQSNIEFVSGLGAKLYVKEESVGVRDYTAAALSSQERFLFGRFEASIQASNVPGVITGFFLHRNSPRQEIDIEIAGSRPDRLMVNVFYNPGGDGANYDYGCRGSPSYIELGFDASKGLHRYAIEWTPCEISWLVDDRLVHTRLVWNPTPIPHLPMALHVNLWPCRSTELAGRLRKGRLPAIAMVKSISVDAASVGRPHEPGEEAR